MSFRLAARTAFVIAASTSLAGPAAAAVTYVFQVSSPGPGQLGDSFTYVSSDFITSRTVAAAGLAACQASFGGAPAPCSDAQFIGAGGGPDIIAFGADLGGLMLQDYTYFDSTAFATLGVHERIQVGWGGRPLAWLTVSGAPTVPEPATWALILAGFGLAGTALRLRRATLTLG